MKNRKLIIIAFAILLSLLVGLVTTYLYQTDVLCSTKAKPYFLNKEPNDVSSAIIEQNSTVIEDKADLNNSRLLYRTSQGIYDIDLLSENSGDPYLCDLKFIANSHKSRHELSIKKDGWIGGCNLFQESTFNGYYDAKSKDTYLFFESAFGGDGDHTPPILHTFIINKKEFRKLSEVKIVNASYIKKDQVINKITGDIVVNFCMNCDGWDVADSDEVFLIPVEIRIGCGGTCTKVLLDESEKKNILLRMEKQKRAQDADYLDIIEQKINKTKELFATSKST